MSKLFWFPDPLDNTTGTLRSDFDGVINKSQPGNFPLGGRAGIYWDVPLSYGNIGAQIVLSNPDYNDEIFKGVLLYDYRGVGLSGFLADDSRLVKKEVSAPPPVEQKGAWAIIQDVAATGQFNLATKEGCGQFTEECCNRLHLRNSQQWGHIRKSGAQNQYNGHAVDAVMLLLDSFDTKAGIYDLIVDSESPRAKPALNFQGPPDSSLWFFPAKPTLKK